MFIVRSSLARWRWLLGVEDIFAAIVFVYCPWTDTSLKGGRYFWYASTHYEWTVWPWKTRLKILFNLIGSTRNNSMTTINRSIFNMIRWLAGSLKQTTQRPIVWCSKHYFFIISRALKTLYFYLSRVMKKYIFAKNFATFYFIFFFFLKNFTK